MSEHMTENEQKAACTDPLARALELATCDGPADSPDARAIPHYLQAIALSLADIAQTLRNIDWRESNHG